MTASADTPLDRPDQFAELHEDAPGEQPVNLEMLLDVPVTVSVELGRARLSLRELLQLKQGAVLELDHAAGEPLDVLVNGTLIAHGEVGVTGDRFAIRLSDVVSPTERMKKLR